MDDLNNRLLAKSSSLEVEATRFRPNIILSRTPSLPPYAEDSFLSIAVGDQIFTVRLARYGQALLRSMIYHRLLLHTRHWDSVVVAEWWESIKLLGSLIRNRFSRSLHTDDLRWVNCVLHL